MPAQRLVEQGERRREAILEFIREYMASYGYAPSIAEIGKAVDIVSTSAVRDHLHRMAAEGLIEITPGIARSIRVVV